jgi:hypothetical protein
MDALLDDSIAMLTCFGKAGTGKTLLSTACALHQTHDDHSRYDGVSISRPVIALGKDIGFLPGSLEEKMKPWLQPYHDALEVLIPSKPPRDPQFAAKKVAKKKHKKHDGNSLAAMSAPVRITSRRRGRTAGAPRSSRTSACFAADWWKSRRWRSSAAVPSRGASSSSTRRSSSRRTRLRP